ncbi:Piwi domain-containing protein [Paenibacillus puerhi]|uniref:Piwi domain-containing protein n=1 Tax=Paenibacillus puerhi TaxID=2692622 RepID=UPI00135949D2|nr:Piwi domain-containing protein [Paenibacillus puerhi]
MQPTAISSRSHPYILTEWTSDTITSQLPIHLYTLPVRNIQEKHQENKRVSHDLKRLNRIQLIEFYEHLIAAWEPIHSWDNHRYVHYEYRPIDPSMRAEREMLERLLLRTLEAAQPLKEISARNRKFTWLKPEKVVENISIHRTIYCDVRVDEDQSITVGFDMSHQYRTEATVLDLLSTNSIHPGDRVIDKYSNMHYEFVKQSDLTLEQPVPELNQSILDYFLNQPSQAWKVKGLNPGMPVVYVKNIGNPVAYAPVMLQKELALTTLPKSVIDQTSDVYKQNADTKMSTLLKQIQLIFSRTDKLTFSREKFPVHEAGYHIEHLQPPELLFGKSTSHDKFKHGLDRGGVYAPRTLIIHLFANPGLLQAKRDLILNFTNKLSKQSVQWGVELKFSKTSDSYMNTDTDFSNPHQLALLMKRLTKAVFQEPTLIIGNEKEAEMWYDLIKKEFGARASIPTQFINVNTISKANEYVIGNILLGLYAKANIQSWILNQSLSSDCFIGLDVSHEEGRHSTGITHVIGRDGMVLSSKANTSNEAGEKIRHETMCQIVYSALDIYEQQYGETPRHITFHRDGRCHEDLAQLDEVMASLNVSYDMIEIIKKSNRRMAYFTREKKWETKQGCYYLKGNTAYLTSTNPHPKIGVAQPVKIVKKQGSLSMQKIVQDVYHLSFMHVGSLLKPRLPVTTYYADLSSTFFNRQWMPADPGQALHFV